MHRWSILPLLLCVALAGCQNANFCVLGYTTEPNYDLGIRTVRVPIFKNSTFRRGVEFDLTRAVIREIESKTPYKIVNEECNADTELIGVIVGRSKNVINFNQLFEVRDAETTLTVELVWRDLRPGHTGEILSRPPLKPGAPLPPPDAPVPPVLVQAIGSFVPELGGSLTSAEKQAVDSLAVRIVSMMERPF